MSAQSASPSRLRSEVPVGSPRWATRRAQWRALGLTDEDLTKPKIAIVNSSSGLAPCFSHLDPIAAAVKRSVEAAGGVAFEIRTVAPTDFIMSAGASGGYVLSSRDLLANDIEAVVEGAQLDGMVCLASCDKTTPGQLMAAARLDVPALILSCGYQSCGTLDTGERVDIEEVFLRAGGLKFGGITFDGLCDLSARAITGPGVCTGMGTANSMHVVAEALGMTLPGSAPVRANSEPMWRAVEASGAAIVGAVLAGRRPRSILTPAAFANAVMAVLAVSGSINCVKHLQAIAREADSEVDVYRLFEKYADTIRPLSAVRPNGEDTIEEFEDAGGALAVLKQLGDALAGEAVTVTGETTGDRVARAVVKDERIIRPLSDPRAGHPTVVVVRGSLAPDTAIVKLSVTEDRPPTFEGTARVFDDALSAIAAIEGGVVRPGDVLVLRGVGPVGTPGMGMASQTVFALNGAGLTEQVAVVTDGQLSGLVNKGIVVGEVSPEGVLPGPLGVVADGDRISIDLRARRADLLVDDAELARRHANRARHQVPGGRSGWLPVYARSVEPLPRGATLRGNDLPTTRP
ncbi:dihydroxy-acid dehydratase [Nonomuraea glycinis]|uniref:Dihydroxy-acid dehydratase n=1 Tax=Nonomuraea glycinis TaxID=2047744 RepID=A0A918E8F2_9ACTN|nr:dihydroxy-acid dehydratase [Nonomuraea glycinis]MCA2181500.1 dihydroxy-acid dehydratase [Nonomuraea glycinis]GGP14609.1 dihydroxy-acid dehydratase [Nonomuraea glycinis]